METGSHPLDTTEARFCAILLVAVLAAGLGIGRPLVRWLARRG